MVNEDDLRKAPTKVSQYHEKVTGTILSTIDKFKKDQLREVNRWDSVITWRKRVGIEPTQDVLSALHWI